MLILSIFLGLSLGADCPKFTCSALTDGGQGIGLPCAQKGDSSGYSLELCTANNNQTSNKAICGVPDSFGVTPADFTKSTYKCVERNVTANSTLPGNICLADAQCINGTCNQNNTCVITASEGSNCYSGNKVRNNTLCPPSLACGSDGKCRKKLEVNA